MRVCRRESCGSPNFLRQRRKATCHPEDQLECPLPKRIKQDLSFSEPLSDQHRFTSLEDDDFTTHRDEMNATAAPMALVPVSTAPNSKQRLLLTADALSVLPSTKLPSYRLALLDQHWIDPKPARARLPVPCLPMYKVPASTVQVEILSSDDESEGVGRTSSLQSNCDRSSFDMIDE